jgi:pimeloyl-ACP methyl ester carboxylesterase
MVALVLLPGTDGTTRFRAEFAAALTPTIEPTVVSYPADQAFGYRELEALVRSVLPADRPYILLGESFSGPIAISIAASCPPGLIGLALCGSFARNPLPVLGPLVRLLALLPLHYVPVRLLSALLLGRFASASLRAGLRAALQGISPATLRARIAAVLGVEVSSALPRIRVQVLYLRGSEDHLVPASCADDIARGAPQTRIAEIVAPHCLLQAAPDAAAAAVKAFAQTL